jgi:hypothetical protein
MIKDKFGCAEFYNLKQPFRKTSKYSAPFILIILLFATTLILNSFWLFKSLSDPLNLTYLCLLFTSFLFLLLSTCYNPGLLKNPHPSTSNLF